MWSLSFTAAVCLAALPPFPAPGGDPKQVKPTAPGFRITESLRVAPGVYTFEDAAGRGAITIAGDDLTVDFSGVTLVGSPKNIEADSYAGRGIVIRGRNVTVTNATVRGYKVGIYAEDSPGIKIAGCDVSGNYRQRLRSTIEREDVSDWLFGHENDRSEWLRFGAGIYLFRCPKATVSGCRSRNGQNGLCISGCDEARIVDNDMSFMSGWGLAMWRSSRCEVMNNKFDFCMRGYSHGVYSRGQDSAGILVYEQCNENVFAYNSATHGGDGFFLYAGNETLKRTGRGGCNGNVVYRNDFSHAAANGIEATFSGGNFFIENIIRECNHGVWAGYSYDTVIENNTITDCRYGISIEHGRGNRISGNTITGAMPNTETGPPGSVHESTCAIGVNLWWDDDKDLLASPFCRQHDRCRSSGNFVVGNRFEKVKTAVRMADDTAGIVADSTMVDVDVSVHVVGDVSGARLYLTDEQRAAIENEGQGFEAMPEGEQQPVKLPPIDVVKREPRVTRKGAQDAFLPEGAKRGRQFIFIDEWGPYDFTDVRLSPSRVYGGEKVLLQILGPGSKFRVAQVTGRVEVEPRIGTTPAKLTLTAVKNGAEPFELLIEADGQQLRATGVLFTAEWKVAFYGWSKSDDPRSGSENWGRIIAADPLGETTVSSIDFTWAHGGPYRTATVRERPNPNAAVGARRDSRTSGRERQPGQVQSDYFATVATTKVHVPAGKWRVWTMSDDGVRVFVDGKEVIRNWTWHGPTLDEAYLNLEAGEHPIRIEHFEIDGYAQLRLGIEPA